MEIPTKAILWFVMCISFWIFMELYNLPTFVAIVLCLAISYYVAMGGEFRDAQ